MYATGATDGDWDFRWILFFFNRQPDTGET
jgi:hypothetical protein